MLMKSLIELLNKTYDKKLCDLKEYKKEAECMKQILKEHQIPCQTTADADCFRYEIITKSIKIKQTFEDAFFDTYVKMFDFWYDLTYLERKKQMNVDIERLKETLVSFSFDGEDIFMPCFDAKFNHLYNTEIVLLDLKQYHAFIRTFHQEVKDDLYGVLPYEKGFTSATLVAQMGASFILYHPLTHRLYLYEENKMKSFCSLGKKQEMVAMDEVKELATLYLLQREEDMAQAMLEGTLVNDKMKKKITKWLKKFQKRNKNNG